MAGLEESSLFVLGQNPSLTVRYFQPPDPSRGVLDQLAPRDGLRQYRLQRIQLAVDRGGFNRPGWAGGVIPAPPPCQTRAFELFDPMRGKLVQEHSPKRPIEHFDNLSVPHDAALMEFCVVTQIQFRKLPKRDVELSAYAVPPLENP